MPVDDPVGQHAGKVVRIAFESLLVFVLPLLVRQEPVRAGWHFLTAQGPSLSTSPGRVVAVAPPEQEGRVVGPRGRFLGHLEICITPRGRGSIAQREPRQVDALTGRHPVAVIVGIEPTHALPLQERPYAKTHVCVGKRPEQNLASISLHIDLRGRDHPGLPVGLHSFPGGSQRLEIDDPVQRSRKGICLIGANDRQGPSGQFADIIPQFLGCHAQRTGGMGVHDNRILGPKRRRIIAAVEFQLGNGPRLLAPRGGLQANVPCNHRIEEQIDVRPAGRQLDVQRGRRSAVGLLIAENQPEPAGSVALVLARCKEQAVDNNVFAQVDNHSTARHQRRAADPASTEVVVSHFQS